MWGNSAGTGPEGEFSVASEPGRLVLVTVVRRRRFKPEGLLSGVVSSSSIAHKRDSGLRGVSVLSVSKVQEGMAC